MKHGQMRKGLLSFLMLLSMGLLFSGCASLTQDPELAKDSIMVDASTLVTDGTGNYSDIDLPADMEYDNGKSLAIRTDSFKGGVLQYSGRVDLNSLKEFIIASMQKNQWKLVGGAHYEKVLLAFTKPNKTCMILLNEGMWGGLSKTYATLYITVDMAGSNRVTPFGEPAAPQQ